MNKYNEIVFHQTIDHEFFRSINNVDINFSIRSCPYGGHMLAILDIKRIIKTFHTNFKDFLSKSAVENFYTKSDNINLHFNKDNLKIDFPDNFKTKDLDSSDLELLLGIKSIYSNNKNGFTNYFYFPDPDQRI